MTELITIELRRDSVCAGDDVDGDHLTTLDISADETINSLTRKILDMKYLPTISGGKATWVVRMNDKKIAVLAEQWNEPKFIIDDTLRLADLVSVDKVSRIDLDYCQQADPAHTYNEMIRAL
ncbi:MAG: hypothetical protein WC838_02585 [Candidatus Margulisiibacteriota bacterium]|jgi:hypothetical protein